MIKYFLFVLSILALTSCEARDQQYYRVHPEKLEQAIKHCPAEHPSDISCEQLNIVAIDLNLLIQERNDNPLLFGKRIMALQTQLTEQQQASKPDSKAIAATQQELRQRLAVIRWLTSPTS